MSNPEVAFSNTQDKLRIVTHLVNKLLYESSGEIVIQNARQQVLERLNNLDGKTATDQQELADFDSGDFNQLVDNHPAKFTVESGTLGEVFIAVTTAGSRPRWLELPDTSTDEKTNRGLFGTEDGSGSDLSQLDCLTEHQPDALRENGFHTFGDIWQASLEELMEIPGIAREFDANQLKEEASMRVDSTEAIAWEAFQRESGNDGSTILGNNAVVEAGAEAHKLTSVKVPAGEARNPSTYYSTNFDCHVHGLPVLKQPTLSAGIVQDYTSDADSFEELIGIINTLIKYNTQKEPILARLREEYETLDDIKHAVENNPEEVNRWLTQPGVETEQLADAIEQHVGMDIETRGVIKTANSIDAELERSAPERSRIALVEEMREILNEEGEINALLKDSVLENLVATSATPAEVDHPFISDPDDLPDLKTRELDNGETDKETVARLTAKNTYAVDLIGYAGVGKDTLFKVLAAETNRPIQILNMDNTMLAQELYGEHQINEDGQIVFEDGVFPHGAKYGFWVVLSEANAAPGGILTTLHQAFEKEAEIHVKQNDEIIVPSPMFRLGTTRNPPTDDFNGTQKLNDAFKNRINPVWISYLDKTQEVDLINDMVNNNRKILTEDQIRNLVQLANIFRQNADSENYPRLTPRTLEQIADRYDGSDGDLVGAAKGVIRGELDGQQLRRKEDILNRVEDPF